MDPLSVMASVAGLLSAAGAVSSLLFTVKSNLVDAPRVVDHILSEVRQAEIYLFAMHKFITKVDSAPIQRRALIQVEQLLATLMESVLTFSELEALVKPLAAKSEMSLRDRAMWILKEDTVSGIVQRMQHQKSFFSLMLNIMQCESDFEAEKDRAELQKQQFEVNQDIYARLRNLEENYESSNIRAVCSRNADQNEDEEETATITPDRIKVDDRDEEILNYADAGVGYSFEGDLNTSRVYKRTHRYRSNISFTSSTARSHAWSVFSGVSLAKVSIISAIALPVYSNEISNSERYNFGKLVQAGPQGAAPRQKAPSPPKTTGDTEAIMTPPYGRTPEVVSKLSLQKEAVHRIVVVGYGGVGKTTLTIELCRNNTTAGYDPTVEDSFRKQATIDGKACTLDVFDVGSHRYGIGYSDEWINACEGFVLIYSITDRKSFAYIENCYSRILRIQESKDVPLSSPMILVGNKCDWTTQREVSLQEGFALARKLGIDFLEASATNTINVEKIFYDVVRSVRIQRALASQKKLTSANGRWAGGRNTKLSTIRTYTPGASHRPNASSGSIVARAAPVHPA